MLSLIRNPAMLKKSSKGNKVSGKSDNDTEDVYGGEVTIVTKIFFVWMTGFLQETEDNYEEINLKRGDALKREDISEVL